MALIHDDPEHPMTVYRVQHESGAGPHMSGESSTPIRQDRGRRPPPFDGRYGEAEVFAEGDFDEADHADFRALCRRSAFGTARFGFLTRSDAARWFGQTYLRRLAADGFTVQPALAARVWRSRSGKQVFFEPVDEPDDD